MINPAGKDIVFDIAASNFEPCVQTFSGVVGYLKLDWPPCLALSDRGPRPDYRSAHQITDLQLDEVTASQVAVDR